MRCVSPGFDSSARRPNNATVFLNSAPEHYAKWLDQALEWTAMNPPEQQLLFINAWNEWAEGNHLEPDAKYGRAYLEATQRTLAAFSAR